jgi:hypothetical protein
MRTIKLSEEKLEGLSDMWRECATALGASGPECISVCLAVIDAFIIHHAESLADALKGVDSMHKDMRRNMKRHFAEKGKRIN